MRRESFANGQFYHVFNRGVDKRMIFLDRYDYTRFLQSMEEFNSIEPIGSIYERSFDKDKTKGKPLIKFVAYCINPNHYHFILQQVAEKGIERFMQRLGMGYAKYFNNKYKRNGVLFQGKFKAKHVDSNEYLLRLGAYVNLNYKVHKLGHRVSKSSWEEYISDREGLCAKNIILRQFKNIAEWRSFAEDSLDDILKGKEKFKEMGFLLEE